MCYASKLKQVTFIADDALHNRAPSSNRINAYRSCVGVHVGPLAHGEIKYDIVNHFLSSGALNLSLIRSRCLADRLKFQIKIHLGKK